MDENIHDLNSLNEEQLDEIQHTNSKKISNLEDEIKQLKIQISQYGPNTSELAGYKVIQRPDGSTNIQDVQNKLDTQIRKLSKRINETETLTGITIENVEREVLELGSHSCRKRFTLTMTILGRVVLVDYELCEDWSVLPSTQQITWFEVKFEEDINEAIGDLIIDTAENQEFHGVFELLKSYLAYRAGQKELVRELINKYPDLVSVQKPESGDAVVLKISNPDPRHPTFSVTYGRRTTGCHIEVHATLSVQASQELRDKDDHDIIGSASTFFEEIKKEYGLERAIEKLVNIVGGDSGEDSSE